MPRIPVDSEEARWMNDEDPELLEAEELARSRLRQQQGTAVKETAKTTVVHVQLDLF